MQLSLTEEDYLKTIYHLSQNIDNQEISTNDIAKKIDISAASVSDMIKKLSNKKLINYIKYQGVSLTEIGKLTAVKIIRKHRLWETFLVEKLKFTWDEIHIVAEQLEHIDSDLLIQRLDEFLEFPQFDPHGDAIPNEKGEITIIKKISLKEANTAEALKVVAVEENSPTFLKYLSKLQIKLGTNIKIIEKNDYDNSIEIEINQSKITMITKEVAENLYVIKI
ncbi:MAG: metal-dependent transcriptional regulator [Bacteroidetes bacterium]|nr:MAG: metal-dependent transcriptional regulator [Bacteroidota bacterium]TAG85651.1 MAG: metal-dependent transcriptional regulator [Bacteroidota bacterium]